MLPVYLNMEFEKEVREDNMRNPPTPPPPSYDPSVATAIFEQT